MAWRRGREEEGMVLLHSGKRHKKKIKRDGGNTKIDGFSKIRYYYTKINNCSGISNAIHRRWNRDR
jgi:hypothetical protein